MLQIQLLFWFICRWATFFIMHLIYRYCSFHTEATRSRGFRHFNI
jgi:hypothetical protein